MRISLSANVWKVIQESKTPCTLFPKKCHFPTHFSTPAPYHPAKGTACFPPPKPDRGIIRERRRGGTGKTQNPRQRHKVHILIPAVQIIAGQLHGYLLGLGTFAHRLVKNKPLPYGNSKE